MTATQARSRASETLYSHGQELIAEEARQGNDLTPWRWQGYHGVKCGGVSIGLRADGFIMQLRSESAGESWRRIMPHVDNVSRVDLQLTARLTDTRAQLIRSQYARLRRGIRRQGRPLDSTLIDSRSRGSSLYLGRRSSETYARMYDKGAEERTAPLGTLFRWEVEYKRESARQMVAGLLSHEVDAALVGSTVSGHFRTRGVIAPALGKQGPETPRGQRINDRGKRLDYLRRVINPMLSKLLDHYTSEELITILGLDEETTERRKLYGKER